MSGSDHGGEDRDWSQLKSAMAGEVQAQLQYTMDEVDMSASRAARQFKESNQKSVGWHGLSIRVRSYSTAMQMQNHIFYKQG